MVNKQTIKIIDLIAKNYSQGLSPDEYSLFKAVNKSSGRPVHLDYYGFFENRKICLLSEVDEEIVITGKSKIKLYFRKETLQVDYLDAITEEVKLMPISKILLLENTLFSKLLSPVGDFKFSIEFEVKGQFIEYGFIHILKVIQLLIEKNLPFSKLCDFLDSGKFKLQLLANGADNV